MAWDRPAGYVPPAEAAAAAEAAAKMEAERAAADARTEAITDAIRDGFGMLATAILAASTVNHSPEAVPQVVRRFEETYDRLHDGHPPPEPPGPDGWECCGGVPPLHSPGCTRHGVGYVADDDADLDDLITPDDGDTT